MSDMPYVGQAIRLPDITSEMFIVVSIERETFTALSEHGGIIRKCESHHWISDE